MTQTEQQDVISILVQDHREVEELFVRLEELASARGAVPTNRDGDDDDDKPEAKVVAEQVVMELVRHAVAEEQYVYPAIREHLPGGNEFAEKEIAEHAEAEQTMKALEKLDPDDAEFWTRIHALMAEIREHIAGEENEMFPALRAAVSEERLIELGEKVEKAKKMAPTRPHPAAPDRPPLNKILGPGTALVDRVRDALTGRGKE